MAFADETSVGQLPIIETYTRRSATIHTHCKRAGRVKFWVRYSFHVNSTCRYIQDASMYCNTFVNIFQSWMVSIDHKLRCLDYRNTSIALDIFDVQYRPGNYAILGYQRAFSDLDRRTVACDHDDHGGNRTNCDQLMQWILHSARRSAIRRSLQSFRLSMLGARFGTSV